jgi:hypothetical protein
MEDKLQSPNLGDLGSPPQGSPDQDAIFGAIWKLFGDTGVQPAPVYPAGPHCNQLGLSPLGERLLSAMIDDRILFDPDHMSVAGRNAALDYLEEQQAAGRPVGVVSSHSWSTPDAYPRIYRLGGFDAPYAGDSTGFVEKWRQHLGWTDRRFYFGFGFGSDMNGFGAQGDPRGAAAADLFETYVVTVGATMVLTALLIGTAAADITALMALPLLVGGVCIITSIIGTYMVRLGKGQSIMGALYKGFWTTAILSIPALYLVTQLALGDLNAVVGGAQAGGLDINGAIVAESTGFTGWDLFYCMMIGLAVTGLLVWITEYYTGTNYRPVQSIAKASETGHGTNVIQGLAISERIPVAMMPL